MNKCPVCDADIEPGIRTCSVCDTDLTIIGELSRAPEIFRESAADALQSEAYSEAVRYSEMALELEPDNPKTLRCLASAREAAGQSREALVTWRHVLTLIPDDEEARSRIGVLERALHTATPPARRTGFGAWALPLQFAGLALLMALGGWYGRGVFGPERMDIPNAAKKPPIMAAENAGTKPASVRKATDGGGALLRPAGNSGPATRPAEAGAESSAAGLQHDRGDSGPDRNVVEKVREELPAEVRFKFEDGGIFLEGWVNYPWNKARLEEAARTWGFRFVDTTHVSIKSPDALHYRVQKGDTLSGIAKRFHGRQASWDMLYHANRHILNDPNTLEVGQRLVVFTLEPE